MLKLDTKKVLSALKRERAAIRRRLAKPNRAALQKARQRVAAGRREVKRDEALLAKGILPPQYEYLGDRSRDERRLTNIEEGIKVLGFVTSDDVDVHRQPFSRMNLTKWL